jgi:hypothetical protein
MGNLNKTYLGYRPKDDNVVKLAQYLASKNGSKTVKSASNTKFANLSSNKIMKNKRF